MPAEQAVFTSLARRGKAGYHVVARSPGVTESETSDLAHWSPSHGSLIVDPANRTSVNFLPLSSGRFAISRTIEGGPEYSGRGGRQLYTHALIVEADGLRQSRFQVFAVYRDALALGHLRYRSDPAPALDAVPLSALYPPRDDDAFAGLARDVGRAAIESVLAQLAAGRTVVLPYAGDRSLLAEYLISRLPSETILATSFSTSLAPSVVRPYRLTLVAPG